MSSLIAPSFSPNAAASSASAAASTAASGARGRNAEEPGGRSFNAVLTRSRNAGASQAQEGSAPSGPEATERRKPSRAGDRKDDLPVELLPLAFFAPMVTTTPAAVAALPAEASGAAVAADGTQGLLPGDAPVAALSTDTADALPGGSSAVDLAGETPASAALTHDARRTASDAAQPRDAGRAAGSAPHAAAQVPLPATAGMDTGTSTVAAPGADAATANAATTAAAATSTTGEPAGALASSPTAEDPASVPLATMISADTPDLASTSDAPASSIVLASMPPTTPETARANVPAASAHAPMLSVEPSVGSAAWGKAIGHQMLRMNAAGYQVAELNLNPAGLGPLKVTLSIGDNQAQAMFVSAHESVRKAIEVALPQLRASLADQGISLGQTSIGAQSHPSAGQGGAFGQQPQQQGSSRQPEFPAPGRPEAIATAEPLHGIPPRTAPRGSSTSVDTFA